MKNNNQNQSRKNLPKQFSDHYISNNTYSITNTSNRFVSNNLDNEISNSSHRDDCMQSPQLNSTNQIQTTNRGSPKNFRDDRSSSRNFAVPSHSDSSFFHLEQENLCLLYEKQKLMLQESMKREMIIMNQKEQIQRKNDLCLERLRQTEEKNQQLQGRMSQLQNLIDSVQGENEVLKEKFFLMTNNLKQYESNQSNYQKDLEQLKEQNFQLASELQTILGNTGPFKQATQKVASQIIQANQLQQEKLVQQNNKLKDLLIEADSQLGELSSERASFLKQIEILKDQQNEKQNRISYLQEQVFEMSFQQNEQSLNSASSHAFSMQNMMTGVGGANQGSYGQNPYDQNSQQQNFGNQQNFYVLSNRNNGTYRSGSGGEKQNKYGNFRAGSSEENLLCTNELEQQIDRHYENSRSGAYNYLNENKSENLYWEQTVKSLKNENSILQEKIDQKNSQLKALEHTIFKLKAELQEVVVSQRNQKDILNKELSSAFKQKELMRKDMLIAHQKIGNFEKEINQWENYVNQLQNQLDQRTYEIKGLQLALQHIKQGNSNNQFSNTNNQHRDSNEETIDRVQNCHQNKEAIGVTSCCCSNTKAQLSGSGNKQKRSMSETVHQYQEQSKNIADLEQKLEEAQKAEEKLKKQLKKKEKKIKVLESKIEDSQNSSIIKNGQTTENNSHDLSINNAVLNHINNSTQASNVINHPNNNHLNNNNNTNNNDLQVSNNMLSTYPNTNENSIAEYFKKLQVTMNDPSNQNTANPNFYTVPINPSNQNQIPILLGFTSNSNNSNNATGNPNSSFKYPGSENNYQSLNNSETQKYFSNLVPLNHIQPNKLQFSNKDTLMMVTPSSHQFRGGLKDSGSEKVFNQLSDLSFVERSLSHGQTSNSIIIPSHHQNMAQQQQQQQFQYFSQQSTQQNDNNIQLDLQRLEKRYQDYQNNSNKT